MWLVRERRIVMSEEELIALLDKAMADIGVDMLKIFGEN